MASAPGIQVSVNGEVRQVPSGTTIADLLRLLARDRVEIVTFVGGGSPVLTSTA
jgi:sulfur carrier protein ThiS